MKNKMKKLWKVVWLLLITAGLCSACQSRNFRGQWVGNNTMIIGISGESGGLDPAGSIANTYLAYAVATMDELLVFQEDGSIAYRGAIAYTTNQDATVWEFTLRPDAQWSDGTRVTARDYLYTIQRALVPAQGSNYVDYLFYIKNAHAIYTGEKSMASLGVIAIDDDTLRFELNTPCVFFLQLVRLPVFMPSTPKGESVSNGPFYLSAYVENQYFVLKRNEYYWNKKNVKMNEMVYRFIDDPQSMLYAYKTGEIDVATNLRKDALALYEGKKDLRIESMLAMRYIIPNMNVSVLQDQRVREALAISIDREALASFLGGEARASYHFIPAGMMNENQKPFIEEERAFFEENVARARTLLAEAGYPEGRGFPELTYTYPAIGNDGDVAQVLQAQWKENLGISIQLEAKELQTYYAKRQTGDFDLIRMHWTADFADPSAYLSMLMTGNAYNSGHVNDVNFDKQMEATNKETNINIRTRQLQEAEKKVVADNFYIIPLFSTLNFYLIEPNIQGIQKIAANGMLDYRYAEKKSDT